MLTIQDCIDLSGLSEEEILAIAEHEHVPEMIAVELGNYLVQTAAGEKRIKAMIVDDMQAARECGDHAHVLKLKLCLRHYLEHHAGAGKR
jgi:DNA repair protein RadC